MIEKKKTVKPSFDQWFQKKHMGFSFESQYMQTNQTIHNAMLSLTREVREYVSDMVQDD